MEKHILDRVIGTKSCLHCGDTIFVEGYTLPEVIKQLAEFECCSSAGCFNSSGFTDPTFRVEMKKKSWLNPIRVIEKTKGMEE